MEIQTQLPLSKRILLGAKTTALSGVIRATAHLSDDQLVHAVRRLTGSNQFPMGQKFLEKALVSLKRAMGRANPHSRKKLIENLIINEMVRGQAQRNWITEQLGYEVPLLLVVSPTMRCQSRCYGCYSAEYVRDSDLDYGLFDRLLCEAKELGSYFVVVSGGEPFVYEGIYDLWRKHSDIWFQVYTSGVTLNDANVAKLAELGNVMPCISVEGFEEQTDRRRGTGHFKKLLQAFERLRKAGIPFGFSATATRENIDLITSDEFVRFYADQGAFLGWYFQYMPIGREPDMSLMLTPEERNEFREGVCRVRETRPLFALDFWGDAPLVGGCIAAKWYAHVNSDGWVEPCIFAHFATHNVHTSTLEEALTSPYFKEIQKRQPFNENLLMPCMLVDNPNQSREIMELMGAKPTHPGAETLFEELVPQIDEYAARVDKVYTPVWSCMGGDPLTKYTEEREKKKKEKVKS